MSKNHYYRTINLEHLHISVGFFLDKIYEKLLSFVKMIFYQTYSGQNQGRKNVFDFRTLRFRAPQKMTQKGKKKISFRLTTDSPSLTPKFGRDLKFQMV